MSQAQPGFTNVPIPTTTKACWVCFKQLTDPKRNWFCKVCYSGYSTVCDEFKKQFNGRPPILPYPAMTSGAQSIATQTTRPFKVPNFSLNIAPGGSAKNTKQNPLQKILASSKKVPTRVYEKCSKCSVELCDFFDAYYGDKPELKKVCAKCRR